MLKFVDKIESHYGSMWGDSGVDDHSVQIPAGHNYHSADVQKAPQNSGAFNISQQPQQGATGAQTIKVNWSYGWFGKARYHLRAYAMEIPPPPVELDAENDPNWMNQARSYFRQLNSFKIVISGQSASAMAQSFMEGQTRASINVDAMYRLSKQGHTAAMIAVVMLDGWSRYVQSHTVPIMTATYDAGQPKLVFNVEYP